LLTVDSGTGGIVLLHHPVDAGQRSQFVLQQVFISLVQLETLPAPEEGSIFEHVDGVRVQGPVGSFSGSIWTPRHFEETVVERQVVTEGILPALRVLAVVRKALHDVAVDIRQRKHPLAR